MKRILITIIAAMMVATNTFAAGGDLFTRGYVEGYLKEAITDRVQIEDYDGTLYTLPVSGSANYLIDQREVKASDFKPGLEVYAQLRGRSAILLEGYSTEVSGYIQPGGKIRSGIIQKIDRDQIILRLPTGELETYFTLPSTIVTKKSTNVPLSTLYEGDRVVLYFDEYNTTAISRMKIEGESIVIKDLYKGKLSIADPFESVITLTGVEVFKNTKWETVKSSMSIQYTEDSPVYIGGQKVLNRNLKYYSGKTVYMAVKNFFGSSRIEKMILKNQYESTYSEKIREINWFTGAFELSNHKNITFNEGSIIIKNGRLVDQYALNPLSDAFVVTDGRGSEQLADVVYIYNEDINNSNIGQNYLYVGRLDQILQDKVLLKNFYLLNKNEWESFKDEKELFYDNDTDIYDLESGKLISPKEFYSLDYSIDEDTDYARDKDLKDWYGYVFTDGDRITGIMVQKTLESLLKQRVTNGIIETVTDDPLVGWKIRLVNATDWSSRKEKWMERTVSAPVNIDKALVIRDGRIVSQDTLKPGDRLYIVRDDYNARVVIVK